MKPALDGRTASVIAGAVMPPLVFVMTGRSSAPTLLAVASIVAIAAGLVVLERELREDGAFAAVSVATSLLTLYGTGLLWHEVVEPGRTAVAFVAGTILVRAWGDRVGGPRADALARGAALGVALAGLAFLTDASAGQAPYLARPSVLDSLFSSRHGLLFWAPVLTVAVLGLALRAARGHPAAIGALTALAVLALVNAGLRPWWSGRFGNARFLPALPLFALGLALVLEIVRRTARQRPLRLAALAGGALVAWNLLLMAQYRAELIPRDDTVSFPAVAENSARLLSGMAGSPTAWPANWVFAAQQDLSPARYDLLAGQDVLTDGSDHIDVGDLGREAWLGEGWSVRHPCGASVCREVEGRARLFLPVVDVRRTTVSVHAQGSGTLRLTLNGRPFTQASLAPAFAEVGGVAEVGVLRRGPNALVLEVSPGGQALVDIVRVVPFVEGR